MLEMLRVIREQEPSKPSTKLSTADGLPTLAANRGTEPAKLTKLVRGELDWIVMKALEKDRNRRYETANGFAMDVQRYLADEPVQACPPSAGYRLRKFVRRNKGPVLAAFLVMLVLVVGIIGTTWGMIRATHAEADAVYEASQKDTALGDKEAALGTAKANEIEAKKQEELAKENEKTAKAHELLGAPTLLCGPDEPGDAGLAGERSPARASIVGRPAAKAGRGGPAQLRVVLPVATVQQRASIVAAWASACSSFRRVFPGRQDAGVRELGPDDPAVGHRYRPSACCPARTP